MISRHSAWPRRTCSSGIVAALGAQPRDVRRHDRLVELGQVVGATPADLDVADQQLAEVEADRRAAPEAEVDHHQVVVLLAGQQVVGAGVPVAQQDGQGVRLGGQRGRVGGRRTQPGAELVVEGRAERVLPDLVAHQDRHHLHRQPAGRVGAQGPLDVAQAGERREGRAGGEPSEEVRRPLEPRQVPRRRPDWDLLQPDRRRHRVEVEDAERAGCRQAVRQPMGEVGAVDLRLGLPRHAADRHLAELLGHELEERRALPRLHLLDEEPERRPRALASRRGR